MTNPNAHILIVDDDLDLCRSLAIILNRQGFVTTTVENGREAIEAVKKDDFELILIDVVMPDLNGLEVLKELKELAPESKMVMMTGFAVAGLVGEAIMVGVDGVLYKPFDVDVIVKSILSDDPLQLFEGYLQTVWDRIVPITGESTAQMIFSKSIDVIIKESGSRRKDVQVTAQGFSLEGLRSQIRTAANPDGAFENAAEIRPHLKRLLSEVFDLLGMLTGEMFFAPLVESLDSNLKSKQ